MEADDPYGAPSISPLLPFQEGRELGVASDDELSRPNNPGRQLFASSHDESEDGPVSSDDPSCEEEREKDRQPRHELNRARAFRRRRLRARNLNRDFEERRSGYPHHRNKTHITKHTTPCDTTTSW